MPCINRIRVSNVKYNFGTQAYDDFTMRLYGKNTLYDLANGGGKSVLMLLLMQCMIPNCTLDEKQPLEKLFRESNGNGTIHSLVEWRLDRQDISDGFRYMTTGFCARKARDRGEESEREVASVEYFNYCIFYQEYGKYDIVNLPLAEGEDRMTYQAMKNYLHDLSRKENRLKVMIFDRKGEYQQFISRYGIIESHWEIIRGINKTEGHVRTYFETNYRTTRKVVEDLLIEEIIEKAYLSRIGQEDRKENAAAKLLMSIREQLRTLSEKKRDIAAFDHEAELIELLRDRIRSFDSLYSEREELNREIGGIYLMLDAQNASREKELQRLQQAVEEAEKASEDQRALLERVRTAALQREYEEKERELREQENALNVREERLDSDRKELLLRRAEGDYLLLAEERKKLEGLLAEENAEVPEEIAPILAGIRKCYDREDEETRRRILDLQEKLSVLERKDAELRKLSTDVRIELAVSRREESAAAVERKALLDRRMETAAKLSEQSLAPAELRIEEWQKREADAEEEILRLQGELAFREEEMPELLHALSEKEEEVLRAGESLEREKELREKREQQNRRVDEICRIYQTERENAAEGVFQKLSRDLVRLDGIRKEQERLERRRGEIREGRWIMLAEGVAAVLSYISTRHGTPAMFGMDFLAQLPHAEKEKLLLRCPELPYGIVARNYEQLVNDPGLMAMEAGGELVRIYNWDQLGEISFRDDGDTLAVRHGEAFFLSPETEEKLLRSLDEVLSDRRTEAGFLKDAVETEKRDLEFLRSAEELPEAEITQEQIEALKKEETLLQAEISGRRKELAASAERLREKEEEKENCTRELALLREIREIDQEEKELARQQKEYQQTAERLERAIPEIREQEEKTAGEREGCRTSLDRLSGEMTARNAAWQERYAAYYTADAAPAPGELPELEAAFRRWKQGRELAEEVLLQRQRLREALESGIRRLRQGISDRGISEEELDRAYLEGRILPVDPEALSASEQSLGERESALGNDRKKWEQDRAEVQKLAGSIEYAIRQYEQAFGGYEEIEAGAEELSRMIPEAEERKKTLAAALGRAREEQKEFQKRSRDWDGIYREVSRLVERNRIDLSGALLRPEDGTGRELQGEFEEILLRLDRNEKSLERAKSQMLRTKGQVTQTLLDMGAAGLSTTIRDDAEIPGNREEAVDLAKRLTDTCDLIRLERSRVEQGVSDMERLRENFVEQCLERCLDVRTELDKLPGLSRIRIGEETVQMVKLSVPYIKEEYLRQRMADYIDRILAEADKKKTEEEQHRYLGQELALKKLFGVIVTDMNRIRLQLYKRERIREQSRYLKYEEAVGSTGQSQGIYIQFLISVINYISGMYSLQDGGERRKTIFIDNPFGAAKDIYIWEPIFALLTENHVQLIVPSRGATPEITGRFDVNYVLGQQMTEGTAVTVVTRYSSRSDEEETEYREMKYEQATFDFI